MGGFESLHSYNLFFLFLILTIIIYEVNLDTRINKISDIEKEIEVILGYDEIKKELEEAYHKERKNIAMPGFRKGKVPMGMIKKMYGEAIEYKACEDIANDKFFEVMKSSELQPVNTPSLTDLNYEKEKQLTFKVKFQVKPELEVKDYKGVEVEKIIFKIRDEDIDGEIARLKQSNSSFEETDVVEGKDVKVN